LSGGDGDGGGNSPPTARNDNFSISAGDANFFLNVLNNDTDPDLPGDSLSIVSVGATSNSGTVINNATSLRYTPAGGFSGTETFNYTISDSAGQMSTATVSVNVPGSGGGGSKTWRVMPIGDSITEASGSRNSYRRPLWHSLNNAGYNINFVGSRNGNRDGQVPNPDFDTQHEGHWGWKADRFLDNNNILNWAQTHQPDIALIHLGTNDIFNGQSVSGTIAEIGQLIDVLRSVNPNIMVLVAKIIPTSDPGRPSLTPFNDAIPALVASKNTARSPVRLVDQNAGFNASVDTYDGVHPDLSGENKMAARWFDALVPLISN
jgi:lysophospholipase L1-like esterase